MKTEFLGRIICPHCGTSPLRLEITAEQGQEVLEGTLCCTGCRKTYGIHNGIPDFRPANLLNKGSISGGNKNIEVKQANVIFHDHMAKYYESDASTLDLFKPYTQSRIGEILDCIANSTEAKLLLDLGCGSGNILLAGRDYFEECLGVDLSPEMLAIAQDRDFQVICADVESVPLPDGIADTVTCFSVLHHLYEPERLFKEAYRLLKDGGVFYSDYDPNSSSATLQSSWLYSFGVKIFKKLFSHRQDNVEALGLSKLQETAEYYHKVGTGLCPTSLKAQLEEMGFTDVVTISHSNCPSLKKNTFWHIPPINKVEMAVKFFASWRPSYAHLATYFLILAQK